MGRRSKRPELLLLFVCAAPIIFRRLLLALIIVCASPAVVEGTEVFDLFVTVCEILARSFFSSDFCLHRLNLRSCHALGTWFPLSQRKYGAMLHGLRQHPAGFGCVTNPSTCGVSTLSGNHVVKSWSVLLAIKSSLTASSSNTIRVM